LECRRDYDAQVLDPSTSHAEAIMTEDGFCDDDDVTWVTPAERRRASEDSGAAYRPNLPELP